MSTATLKRSLLLVPLAALAVGTSGCEFLEVLTAARSCSLGHEPACNFRPEIASVSGDFPAGASSVAGGKGFNLRFRGRLLEEPVIYPESGNAAAGSTLARGRFNGTLLKDSRLSERFEKGRWVASTEFYYDADTRTISGRGFVRVRFADRRAGSVCLYVNVTRGQRKNGALRETGVVIPMGGTGLGARLTGRTRFISREGKRRTRTRGKTGFHLRKTRQAPSGCRYMPRP